MTTEEYEAQLTRAQMIIDELRKALHESNETIIALKVDGSMFKAEIERLNRAAETADPFDPESD